MTRIIIISMVLLFLVNGPGMIPAVGGTIDPEPGDSAVITPDPNPTTDSTGLPFRPIKIALPDEKPQPRYHFADSLKYIIPKARLNLYDDAVRSFQHDAADYLRLVPSCFTVSYQTVPLRKTCSPFTLPGDRMDIIFNDNRLSPLEHHLEPDNMIDFNDLPTAATAEIYNINGPLGMIFGGYNATSSLVMFPLRPDTTRAESKMTVDKGWFGYANTKGLFTIRTVEGRQVSLAAEYRRANGEFSNAKDDAYHHWGEVDYPLKNNLNLHLQGRLYRRDGEFPFRPDSTLEYMNRFRRDRDLSVGLELIHPGGQSSTVTFRHQRSESALDQATRTYDRKLDVYDNSFHFIHERKLGGLGLFLEASARQEKYKDTDVDNKRLAGFISGKFMLGDSSLAWLGYIKAEQVGGFDPAPSAALTLIGISSRLYYSISAGYTTRFPRQYELDLNPTVNAIIGATADYSEAGNPDLKEERQLTANLTLGLGPAGNDLLVSVTGGKITDGIDWVRRDSADFILGFYQPSNHDIDFGDISIRQRLSWRDMINWSVGAGYHYIKINGNDDPAYAPDYQASSGLQIHLYSEKFDLHLYGYGEATYLSAYHGYDNADLGEDIILSIKLSFRIKKFRFYYIFQNAPSVEYSLKENYPLPGRYNYYGLTWEFLD
nr:hypothetical protein [candidate division Zixibacteria bacterium]